MKNLWKFAAALAAIAALWCSSPGMATNSWPGLQKLRDRCCHGGCSCGEKLADAACEAGEAVEEAVEHVAEGAEEVLENVKQAAEEAVEAPQEAVTEEDFAD